MDGLISVEIKAAVVRYHPEGGGYGTPWTWSCVIEQSPDDPLLVDVSAVQAAMPYKVVRFLARRLLELGFERVRHKIKGRWYTHDLAKLARLSP